MKRIRPPTRRIRTVLHGDQTFYPAELELLHTAAFQRLYDLHQLGFTDRIYIDASHSRLQHVVGVVHHADRLNQAVVNNLRFSQNRKPLHFGPYASPKTPIEVTDLATYVEQQRPIVRLMALLHDLTHAPFGHTLEDEVRVVGSKHDHPDRQADAFYRLLCEVIGWLARDNDLRPSQRRHEGNGRLTADVRVMNGWDIHHDGTASVEFGVQARGLAEFLESPDLLLPPDAASVTSVGIALLRNSHFLAHRAGYDFGPSDFAELLGHLLKAMTALLYLELLHKKEPAIEHLPLPEYPFQSLIRQVLDASSVKIDAGDLFDPHRDAFLLDLIGNTICADLLDYARRDSHYTNLKTAYDPDRIVENFTLVSTPFGERRMPKATAERCSKDPFFGNLLRPAIAVFGRKLRLDVPSGLMDLLQARFSIYERALFHPTKCVAGGMLGRAVQLMAWETLPVHFQHIGDQVFVHQLLDVARMARDCITRIVEVAGPDDALCVAGFQAACSDVRKLPRTGASVALQSLLETIIPCSQSQSSKNRELPNEACDGVASTLEERLVDLQAAARLLERLRARRFHRTIFRQLPDMSSHSSCRAAHAEDNGKSITEIAASFFGDPRHRHQTELAIERKAELPRGAIVMHCPPYRGPAKIAEALLYAPGKDGDQDVIQTLRSLNKDFLNGIFTHHANAVNALEQMYHSTWRLTVSVAPPDFQKHHVLNPIIAEVLREELRDAGLFFDSEDLRVENDPTMKEELRLVSQRVSAASSGVEGSLFEEAFEPERLRAHNESLRDTSNVQESVEAEESVSGAHTFANTRDERSELESFLKEYGVRRSAMTEIRNGVLPDWFERLHRLPAQEQRRVFRRLDRYTPPRQLLAAQLTAKQVRRVLSHLTRHQTESEVYDDALD